LKTNELAKHFIINSNLIDKGANTCIYSAMGRQGASFNPKNYSNGLELHWVEEGPIVTLAGLFLFSIYTLL